MVALVSLLLLLCFATPAAVGLLGLGIALDIFTHGLAISLSLSQALLVGALLFVFPCAAYLGGVILDSFLDERRGTPIFSKLLPVLSCAVMFGSGWWLEFVAESLQVARTTGPAAQALLFSSTIGAAAFCAGISAFVAMGLQVLIEVPIRWLQGASRSRTVLPLGALRPLTVVTALALLLNLISGLFAQELWPTTIAAHLAKL